MRKREVGILLAYDEVLEKWNPTVLQKLQGKKVYEHAYHALKAVCDEVVIITNDRIVEDFPPNLTVIRELPEYKGKGPLASVLSGMKRFNSEKYVLLPYYMPYILGKDMRQLMELSPMSADIVAVRTRQEEYPLMSIWSKDVIDQLESALQDGALQTLDFLKKVDTEWIFAEDISIHPEIFRNLEE
ncbi:molybdenum cofactor guanylyltransferase [Paenisporosarcina cavernae]|uniref:Molybdenum cofactor guanylyltransferase n=1 Tax=Paenisporosarcina cavernae TaxID=2320858 RepID=A0A385YSX3_9BACL|nr:molybdenum cofactor guanylyltransferase [Paenisporosarcina cavernae]AYC28543.1 molybdenum cofactor guanylyltransferase [Paenisporosarcina cavernae]